MLKKINLIIYMLFIVCFFYSCTVSYKYFSILIQVHYAEDQIRIFDILRGEIETIDNQKDIALKMDYILNYYPSGSKQDKGSELDIIVEKFRTEALKDIIISLKNRMEIDYGKDPKAWIKEMK